MKIVIILEPNNVQHSENQMTRLNFSLDRIEDTLEDFVEFINVTGRSTLLQTIIEKLTINDDVPDGIHTGTVSHDYDDLYQICYSHVTRE